jgi:flagellar motor switch protein FliM
MEPESPEESRPMLAEVPRRAAGEPARYDFRRAERIGEEHIRPSEAAFTAFLAGAQASLAAYLHRACTISAAETRQVTYSELAGEFPSPITLVSLALRPYHGRALLALGPAVIFPLLEALLGSPGSAAPEVERELTEIERNLLESVLRILVHELREAWRPAGGPSFEVEGIQTGARSAEAFAPKEPVLALAGDLALGEQPGRLHLVLPSIAVRIMGQRPEPQRLASSESSPARERLGRLLGPARVWVEARLEGSHLKLQDAAGLQPGQVLDLGQPVGQPLECLINGKRKHQAQPVSIEGKIGVRVEGRWEPE